MKDVSLKAVPVTPDRPENETTFIACSLPSQAQKCKKSYQHIHYQQDQPVAVLFSPPLHLMVCQVARMSLHEYCLGEQETLICSLGLYHRTLLFSNLWV
jgi:hypothetical protein